MDPEDLPLRDLHLPEAAGWWPPAPGWWLLALAGVVVSVWLVGRGVAKWRRDRPRRAALAELERLAREQRRRPDPVTLSVELSRLLRRAMLAFAARGEVAGLTGQRWLEWLDRGLEDRPFTEGEGRRLVDLPYRRPGEDADADTGELIRAVRRRLSTPLPERN